MCLLMISVSFISLNTYYLKKSLKLFSIIGSDLGKAPGAHYSNPSTGSDVKNGPEVLLNFTF